MKIEIEINLCVELIAQMFWTNEIIREYLFVDLTTSKFNKAQLFYVYKQCDTYQEGSEPSY